MGGITTTEMMAKVPQRAVAFETDAEGRVVLLRPKFLSPRLGWLQKLLPRPEFRVKLDATGSFIWESLDGVRTVGEVCQAVRERFGAEAEPVEERAVALVFQMASGGFIRLL
ncbi:PqqD family protein [Mesoterricola silvestris]|uniref:PqqD family protein n=1 Tax=Mesoterricola silvestris TaxID=2927979 RepID=A0AA48GUM6_9BACT|nr:PqqD family protein [Mesoterricola silvestris]BDU74372.1 hypothetical protein METEAL_35460 [Mesoterricola silvestris]